MRLMKLISSYFKRIFSLPLFYLSILGITAICLFGAYTDGNPFVVQSFQNSLFISSYRNLIVLFAALPFSSVYCREWKERSAYYIVSRTSASESIIAYILVQVIVSFITVFVGMFLSVGILYITLPDFVDTSYVYKETFTQYINEKDGLFFLFILIYHYSVSVAAWSASGLMVSAFFMNSYIAVCSPLVVSYILELFTIGTGKYTDLWTMSISFATIAQAVMENPELLILDEPLNGLDKEGVEDMRKYLLNLKKDGKTIIIASHSAEDIDVLCDNVYEMEKGRIKKIR